MFAQRNYEDLNIPNCLMTGAVFWKVTDKSRNFSGTCRVYLKKLIPTSKSHSSNKTNVNSFNHSLSLLRIIFWSNSDHTLSTSYNVLHLPDVHTLCVHRGSVVGQLLDWSRRDTSTCWPQYHHSSDHLLHVRFRELEPTTCVLRQSYRLLLTDVVWIHFSYSGGVRVCAEVF